MKMTGKCHTSEENPKQYTGEEYWNQEAITESLTEDLLEEAGEAVDGVIEDLFPIPPLRKLMDRFFPHIL